jgi:hypothetical protein
MKPRLLVLTLFAGLFVWFFGDALFRPGMFAFRDAADYYHPLLEFVRGQWGAGRVPLWNPYENLGMPLAGNATSGVFYPGMLIFGLPWDYATAYKIYVLAHVLLAGVAAYRLARHWQNSVEASGLCALSYAFCGNVLYQYSNVIFLVGAAWMPLALWAADRALVGRSLRAALGLGLVLALMVLGGDPQAAYHTGLLAAMYALWLRRPRNPRGGRRKAEGGDAAPADVPLPAPAGLLKNRLVLLAVAAAVALALSAIVVLPSTEFARQSQRTLCRKMQSIYEIPGLLRHEQSATRIVSGLLGRVETGSHDEQSYHFSVGPWRLAEYLWPNVSGRQLPENHRWLDVLAMEGRVWVPSLYMGLLPLVLALARLRWRRDEPRVTWLSWVVLLSVVASFGWHGLGWLADQLGAGALYQGKPWVGEPFGGLYWLMTLLLPGYAQFRFPAKLLTVAALGLSLLAAGGWDQMFAGSWGRVRRGLGILGGLSVAGAIAALAIRPCWSGWFATMPPNQLFGPLDTAAAAAELLGAFVRTAILCGLCGWLIGRASRGARWGAAALLLATAVDLAAANGWMVVCVPARLWQGTPQLAAAIARHETLHGDGQPYRVFRDWEWLPAAWSQSRSPQRLVDAERWVRDTLTPNHNLPAHVALGAVYDTMMSGEYQALLEAMKNHAWANPGRRVELDESNLAFPEGRGLLDAVGTRYFILPGGQIMPHAERIDEHSATGPGPEDTSLWYNPQSFPRAWIVHDVTLLRPLADRDFLAIRRRTDEVFFCGPRLRDFRHDAVVEATSELRSVGQEKSVRVPLAPPVPAPRNTGMASAGLPTATTPGRSFAPGVEDRETARVLHSDPGQVVIEAVLERPGLVVLCDQFYPGWRLSVQSDGQPPHDAPILRTNRVMRGAWLAAGRHRLIYQYRPLSFFCGAALSGAGWLALVVGWIVLWARRRRYRQG